MKRSRSISLLTCLLVVPGMVHNHLVKSDPAAGARLASSPSQIKLWFAERPEIPLTSITLIRDDSVRVGTIKALATSDTLVVVAPISSQLVPGTYQVNWRTASGDGHAIRGTFGFSIAP